MALIRFFNAPKNQRFDYIPRFYDPSKDDLKRRLKQNEQIKDGDVEGMKYRISSGLRVRTNVHKGERSKAVVRSNLILFAVLMFLLFLTYVGFTVYLPMILEFLK